MPLHLLDDQHIRPGSHQLRHGIGNYPGKYRLLKVLRKVRKKRVAEGVPVHQKFCLPGNISGADIILLRRDRVREVLPRGLQIMKPGFRLAPRGIKHLRKIPDIIPGLRRNHVRVILMRDPQRIQHGVINEYRALFIPVGIPRIVEDFILLRKKPEQVQAVNPLFLEKGGKTLRVALFILSRLIPGRHVLRVERVFVGGRGEQEFLSQKLRIVLHQLQVVRRIEQSPVAQSSGMLVIIQRRLIIKPAIRSRDYALL